MSAETPPGLQDLMTRLEGLAGSVKNVDVTAPEEAAAELTAMHPFEEEEIETIFTLCQQGLAEGWLAPHDGGPGVKFGRLAKDMQGFAVDAVTMADNAGRGHKHTRGEINMCFPLKGDPLFDGHAPGWVVFAPGSHHVPTVTDGEMLFLYFTPGGEVVWDPA